ncbi:MAG: hypothetical protein K9J81_03095 [Desulfohalobiaceae bacterium]|nr:hypothetical protein [Desulfohalobiaceae bacterium]
MIGKKIQFFVVLLLVGVAAFSSWYVYQQSQKLKQVHQQEADSYRQELASDAHNATGDSNRTGNGTGSPPQTLQPEEAGEEGSSADSNATDGEAGTLSTKIQDMFLTSFVVKDAAEYFVEQYHPGGSPNDPDGQGTLDVSFKTLNARYGLELVGVKNTGLSLKRAREKILSFLMDPGVLQQSYDLAADDFIRSLIKKAESSEKFSRVRSDAGQPATLQAARVSTFLRLCSAYFQNVAGILEVLAEEKEPSVLVTAYFQAEQEATEAHYMYNKASYAYKDFLSSVQENATATDDQQDTLKKLKTEREAAAEAFRQAIQEREQIRKDLTDVIERRIGELQLDSHDVLYIAQWVQRRLQEGNNRSALQVAAGLLRVLSRELEETAFDYSSNR